jgi:hypothetical protein
MVSSRQPEPLHNDARVDPIGATDLLSGLGGYVNAFVVCRGIRMAMTRIVMIVSFTVACQLSILDGSQRDAVHLLDVRAQGSAVTVLTILRIGPPRLCFLR